ncbi:hypothetical protein O6H91_17G078000 [Diphasiastrum complanatum]|uniref:Uncharacterized protein n=1 Tax=Diphasiastrum complanatum TaxID=34168 RepID=A0ACC2B886_DIPCM|nr:hypothetical protein O6H91_17G078000 [Diphasiastrum complanatum]
MSSSILQAEVPYGLVNRKLKAKGSEFVEEESADKDVLNGVTASHQERSSPPKRAAFFDVDGTITKTNVVMAYFVARKEELPLLLRLFWLPLFFLTCIFYLIIDWFHRPTFNQIFYRTYRGRLVDKKAALSDLIYKKYYQPRIFSGAKELIQQLKGQGYIIVFVTGSLDFLIDPLAKELGADFVYAAEMIEAKGRLTGKLKAMAVSNDEKAMHVQQYALKYGISLSDSLAYGDSVADLQMLEAVGGPHAVNPDSRLRAIATKRGWPILQWLELPCSISPLSK